MDMWEVTNTDEYAAWFLQQTEEDQAIIRSRVFLLAEKGPQLGGLTQIISKAVP
ncbi:hypothetical protein FACS1894110_02860 [Spirochaetia bacterium]|nr:hypothetical protein FACS1894110_02860 [Spirochaetia bacterium]